MATAPYRSPTGAATPSKLNKPDAGHFAKASVDPGKRLVEVRLDDVDGYEVGQEIHVDVLAAGAKVDVTAVSKGKGFAGTMKRHNFPGQGASHGNHKHHRAPGAIGSCSFPGVCSRVCGWPAISATSRSRRSTSKSSSPTPSATCCS